MSLIKFVWVPDAKNERIVTRTYETGFRAIIYRTQQGMYYYTLGGSVNECSENFDSLEAARENCEKRLDNLILVKWQNQVQRIQTIFLQHVTFEVYEGMLYANLDRASVDRQMIKGIMKISRFQYLVASNVCSIRLGFSRCPLNTPTGSTTNPRDYQSN